MLHFTCINTTISCLTKLGWEKVSPFHQSDAFYWKNEMIYSVKIMLCWVEYTLMSRTLLMPHKVSPFDQSVALDWRNELISSATDSGYLLMRKWLPSSNITVLDTSSNSVKRDKIDNRWLLLHMRLCLKMVLIGVTWHFLG